MSQGSGVTIEESDDEKSIVTPNCRLTFRREDERWTHAIEIAAATGRHRFAESLETDPSRDDFRRVRSPTFQDLHFQSDGIAVVAMLVGQFGPRHFSATFRVTWDPFDPDGVYRGSNKSNYSEIDVDFADRSRQPVDYLAATYTIRPPKPTDEMASAWDGSWYERHASWRCLDDARGGRISLWINSGDAPMAALRSIDLGEGDSELQLTRTLLPFQANGRLPFSWHVSTPWHPLDPTTP